MADRRLPVFHKAFHAAAGRMRFTLYQRADVLCMTRLAVTFRIGQIQEHGNTHLFGAATAAVRRGVCALRG